MKRRNENAPYWVMMREAERRVILWGFSQTRSVRQAAMLLGVNPGQIYKRCQKLGINYHTYDFYEGKETAPVEPEGTPDTDSESPGDEHSCDTLSLV